MSRFVHEVIIETTNCAGMSCNRQGKEARWKHDGKRKEKMGCMWLMSRKKND